MFGLVRKLNVVMLLVLFQALSFSAVYAQEVSEKPTQIEIQKALSEAGFYKGTIDGVIGAKTKAAIRSFQEEHGLTVDGKVGPKTWEKLKAYLEEAQEMDNDPNLPQPAVDAADESASEYTMTLEADSVDPALSPTEEELKQKLVS